MNLRLAGLVVLISAHFISGATQNTSFVVSRSSAASTCVISSSQYNLGANWNPESSTPEALTIGQGYLGCRTNGPKDQCRVVWTGTIGVQRTGTNAYQLREVNLADVKEVSFDAVRVQVSPPTSSWSPWLSVVMEVDLSNSLSYASLVWTTSNNPPQGEPSGPQRLDTIVTGKGLWYLTDHSVVCNGKKVPTKQALPFSEYLALCPDAKLLSVGLDLGSGLNSAVEMHTQYVEIQFRQFDSVENMLFRFVFKGITSETLRAETKAVGASASRLASPYAKEAGQLLAGAANNNALWINEDTARNNPFANGFQLMKLFTNAAKLLVVAEAKDLVVQIAQVTKDLALQQMKLAINDTTQHSIDDILRTNEALLAGSCYSQVSLGAHPAPLNQDPDYAATLAYLAAWSDSALISKDKRVNEGVVPR